MFRFHVKLWGCMILFGKLVSPGGHAYHAPPLPLRFSTRQELRLSPARSEVPRSRERPWRGRLAKCTERTTIACVHIKIMIYMV